MIIMMMKTMTSSRNNNLCYICVYIYTHIEIIHNNCIGAAREGRGRQAGGPRRGEGGPNPLL